MSDSLASFTAPDSALGFLYQVRCALLWSLQRLRNESDFSVSLEALDDVAFEKEGTASELLQTKLHKNRSANLTDASPDLWKTIRVWLTASNSNVVQESTFLYLVTTEQASSGSIAAYLKQKQEDRDIDAAVTKLNNVAQTSTSSSNAEAYKAYLGISYEDRKKLVDRIIIIDNSPGINDLDALLKKEIFHAASREHQTTFLEYLEGWWYRRALHQLQNINSQDRILSEEIEAQMSDLRDQFKQDSLPISDDLLNYELDGKTAEAHQSLPFVQQIHLATTHKKRIAAAIRDYYRAFEQRSRWQRQDLLFVGDLSQYEKSLTEEWELVFSRIEDRIGHEATDEDKQTAAKEVLDWVEIANVNARIRPNVTEPFITRGSLHILSNELKIGWHPDFRQRLAHLLEGGAR
ncbi:ABC-three component system protein [Ruficoccus sp. ZRK36]|uniref:ABC-three component system protein n=1 Tax=Ruficoccus sp. ZRK36 TaxID=2866311 RepID=UPI001C72B704|nr:ABC-three component system protein [Ruficoccus sp. ZRK36]QYY34571.1 hypothetical protein K0V07_09675 [Ruficoccus sp. ZRK36]